MSVIIRPMDNETLVYLIHCAYIFSFSDSLLKMNVEEPSFQSEWNDLQALRQLSATSGLRQMKPSVATNDEKDAIKRDGQVTFLLLLH